MRLLRRFTSYIGSEGFPWASKRDLTAALALLMGKTVVVATLVANHVTD